MPRTVPRNSLYSRAPRRADASVSAPATPRKPGGLQPEGETGTGEAIVAAPAGPPAGAARAVGFCKRYRRPLQVLGGVALIVAAIAVDRQLTPTTQPPTQGDIDRAVRRSLEKEPLPSAATHAFETIRPSIVRVDGFNHPEGFGLLPNAGRSAKKAPPAAGEGKPAEAHRSVGTGVVITDSGRILTNLHVVAGTSRINVVFADGSEAAATVIGADPDNDLAVLQAAELPDDLQPATLITTGDLRPGDAVLAVGFPFGFGPSASTGVVSGLRRDFFTSDGQRALSNLIQFDAAANPGNSGGPLVNMEGEVLGIVTAILNPIQQRFFVGVAFAVPIENAASAVGVPPF